MSERGHTDRAMRPLIDAHVHVGLTKYQPLENFRADMDSHGVDGAVLVQYVGHYDNSYLIDCVRQDPTRYTAIAMIDLESTSATDEVARLARNPEISGVRLWASTRSPGADPHAIWRALAEHGLVATVRGPIDDIIDPEFVDIVEQFPGLHFRLEHLGFFRFSSTVEARKDFDEFLELARRPNTSTMWSGFYDFSATPYPHPDATPFLRDAVAAFGANRIAWSGDWNRPDLTDDFGPDDYANTIRHVKQADFLSDQDREWIFGQTTATIFRMGKP